MKTLSITEYPALVQYAYNCVAAAKTPEILEKLRLRIVNSEKFTEHEKAMLVYTVEVQYSVWWFNELPDEPPLQPVSPYAHIGEEIPEHLKKPLALCYRNPCPYGCGKLRPKRRVYRKMTR